MTRDPITNPEVAEDVERRTRSLRDQERTGAAVNPFGPAADVEHWPCRKRCGRLVGVTSEAVEMRKVCNAKLRQRHEPEIATHEVVICDECKALDEDLARMQRDKPRQAEMRLEKPATHAARALASRYGRSRYEPEEDDQ